MNKILLKLIMCAAIVSVVSMTAFAQGRVRGVGQGRRADVFADRDFRGNRNQYWKKCGKFVNCHDARDGRWDGRGPRRTNGFRRDGDFVGRGSNVGYRTRFNTNDYWRRRHLMYGTRYNRVSWDR